MGMKRAVPIQHCADKWCDTAFDCFVQVRLFAAIDANHDGGMDRPAILAAININ
jgi:hypothetical protein